jgi:uncharacterized membrane protein YfcA
MIEQAPRGARELAAPVAADDRVDADARRHVLLLVAVGLISGVMSGLFGIGGGTVTVPLLLLWLHYGEREAAGTSLAAMVVTAALGSAFHHTYGNIDVAKAALVGVPAVGGVMLGTWIQQRIQTYTIALVFSAMLVVVALELAIS